MSEDVGFPESLAGVGPSPRRLDRVDFWLRLALCVAAAVGLYVGWRVFWFQCDDAYIAYRYVSNSQLGLGYTWNPPPFRPVEGYTSFMWVIILDGVWTVLGVEPPVSANWISLACSAGSLALVIAMVLRARLPSWMDRHRTLLLAMVLVGLLTNRTFLAWTSSGLETALFSLLLLGWAYLSLFAQPGRHSASLLALVAAMMALTRPDGILFVVATVGLVLVLAARQGFRWWNTIPPAVLLMTPVIHVLWRHATYGFWLPNTYYAKQVSPWPEAGLRYLAAFALEYAYWIGFVLLLAAIFRSARKRPIPSLRNLDMDFVQRVIASAALVLHLSYYTLIVGGDHFEFRIYQHVVPLMLVGTAMVGEKAGLGPRGTLAALATMIILGWPIPWLHWWHTHGLETRRSTHVLRYEVAPLLPAGVQWYGALWDKLDGWLITHHVGMRHQEHKAFAEQRLSLLPTRVVGGGVTSDGFPVVRFHSVGVLGWVLPHVAVIDQFGLNDVVIAHTRVPSTGAEPRLMAHERRPPRGYVECFRPNVALTSKRGELRVQRRGRALTAAEIRSCEKRFAPDHRIVRDEL